MTRKATNRLKRYLAFIERQEDPRVSFTVYSTSGTLLYVRKCDYGGVQLVSLRVIGLDEPRGDDWSETMRFVRLLPTEHAVQQSEDEGDDGPKLGRESMRKIWISLPPEMKNKVYHEGDVDFKGDVRELIGVARWYPVDKGQPERGYFTECSTADLVFVGPPFRLKLVEDEG